MCAAAGTLRFARPATFPYERKTAAAPPSRVRFAEASAQRSRLPFAGLRLHLETARTRAHPPRCAQVPAHRDLQPCGTLRPRTAPPARRALIRVASAGGANDSGHRHVFAMADAQPGQP